MSFQAYLNNVRAKTGKTPDDFAKLADHKGLNKHGDIVKWLRDDFELGHGHATAIAGVLMKRGAPRTTANEKLSTLFRGKKERWQTPCETLIQQLQKLGSDFSVGVGGSYVSLLRAGTKFGILQPSSGERLDIGIKLKGVRPEGRFELAGKWNAMVTHRVRIEDTSKIDQEVVSWLKRGYEASA
jgi:hypothetical protein